MTTPNLLLSEYPTGSLTPSVPFNDDMQALDALVQLSVETITATPPTTVAGDVGKRWLVGASATGAWAGKDDQIALCTAADTWRYFVPGEGWRCDVRDEDIAYRYSGSAWEVTGGGNASAVPITDAGGYFAATDVEGALQELGAGGGGGGSLPAAYGRTLAALLEPDAVEAMQTGTFSYAINSSTTKMLLASWQTRLGSTGRFEVRNPERPMPLRGVTLAGTGSGSCAMLLDPAAVTYADPWTTYYDRLATIHTLPTRVIPLTGASQKAPFLPGPYGCILTHVTCFNLCWVVTRFGNVYGLNLMDEENDSAPQRVGSSLMIPYSKRVGGEIETSSASTTTGGAPYGSVCFVQLPSTWGEVADPLVGAGSFDFRDDFMGAALDTGVWTRLQSTAGNVEIDATYNWLKFSGNATWGTNGVYRTTGLSRTVGKSVVVDVFAAQSTSASGCGIYGWSDGGGHSYTNMAHGLNFAGGTSPGGALNVYENGVSRGTVGSGWTSGCIYRVKVTLTSGGATYWIQGGTQYPPIGGATWTDVTPGTSSSATATVHPGGVAYGAGVYISDFRVF